MAEEAVLETTETIETTITTEITFETTETTTTIAAEDMDVETLEPAAVELGENRDSLTKRGREEEGGEWEDDDAKKQKVEEEEEDKSVEEQRLAGSGRVSLGPKSFGSSVEMFEYVMKFLHFWTPNLNVNKYEHMVLLDLLKKGHAEPEKKIGDGIHAFQVRFHPMWKSRCFFLIRDDESVDDFSFRKCVDHILPLPEHMKVKSDANKALGGSGRGGRGGGGRGGGGRGRGRGRGGKWRN